MHLTGIIDAQQFRNRIMAAREAMKLAQRTGVAAPDVETHAAAQLAALRGIEEKLIEIVGLLKEGR
jgi:hypothetical protein